MNTRNWSTWIWAAIGAGVVAYVLAIRPRAEHRANAKRTYKEDLLTWEGEGGNLAPRTTARS